MLYDIKLYHELETMKHYEKQMKHECKLFFVDEAYKEP